MSFDNNENSFERTNLFRLENLRLKKTFSTSL